MGSGAANKGGNANGPGGGGFGGYGGGYYDRLRCLERWSGVPALVVLPSACVSVQALPSDPWDQPFQGWLSENGFHQTLP